MIYTVTLNPSLDYLVTAEEFAPGRVNRTRTERILPGGKGINVSQVLAALGIENVALGFLAGFTGEEIRRCLAERGVGTDFLEVSQGFSRINLKLRVEESTEAGSGPSEQSAAEETEINGSGPVIGPGDLARLYEQLDGLTEGDTLVLAGSIPGTLPDTVYQDICARVAGRGIRVVVDTTGSRLMKVLPYRPFLIKPNHHELGELFGVTLREREEVISYARQLQELGAMNVLVSMGSQGAVLVAEDGQVYQAAAPTLPGCRVKNAVGAGDSMVAGFLAGLGSGTLTDPGASLPDYREAFALGLCAGSASAFSEDLATAEEVERLRSGFSF